MFAANAAREPSWIPGGSLWYGPKQRGRPESFAAVELRAMSLQNSAQKNAENWLKPWLYFHKRGIRDACDLLLVVWELFGLYFHGPEESPNFYFEVSD